MKLFSVNKRLKPAGGDIAVISTVIILAIVIAIMIMTGSSSRTKTLRILQDGDVIEEVRLRENDEERIIEIDGKYHNTVIISGGEAGFVESDCPNQDCVNRGMISNVGQSAVCLPNHVVLEIVGDNQEIDAVLE